MPAKYPVQATRHSVAVLQTLDEMDGATLVELEDRLELAKSVIHNHLQTLEEAGLVTKSEYTYRPSLQLFELGAAARRRREGFETAREKVDDLSATTGEQVNLVYEDRGRGTIVYQQTGDQSVNSDLTVGSRVDLHCTAAGKAILAVSSPDLLETVVEDRGLTEHTNETVTDETALREELETIVEDVPWIAEDRSERVLGIRCLATPLIDQRETCYGAISVTLPNHRFRDEDYRAELTDHLEEIRSEISAEISYS
jgi:DNA-binding IclR family transcriptional regulator